MSDKYERNSERRDAGAVLADNRALAEDRRERMREEFCDPVCIHTDQVYDSCRERDCIENQRVFFTQSSQNIIDRAINVKAKSAEIIWIYTDLEEVPFNRGFFTVDIKYFFRVTFEVFLGVSNPVEVEGLTTFDKKVILFGSEGSAKIFTSKYDPNESISQMWKKNNLPTAIVEAVEPIALSAKLVDAECCCGDATSNFIAIPKNICSCFDDELVIDSCERTVLVSLGIFTIVKIERKVQLLVNAVDFCVPNKECVAATDENPCALFNRIRFPMDEFFPPQRGAFDDDMNDGCGCGCGCGER